MLWGSVFLTLAGSDWNKFDTAACKRPLSHFRWQWVFFPAHCWSEFISSMLTFAEPSTYSRSQGLMNVLSPEKNFASKNSFATMPFKMTLFTIIISSILIFLKISENDSSQSIIIIIGSNIRYNSNPFIYWFWYYLLRSNHPFV